MIIQPPAKARITQQRVTEGIEQDLPHVPLIDRALGPVRIIQHRQQAQRRVLLKLLHRLAQRPPQPNERARRDKGQALPVRQAWGRVEHHGRVHAALVPPQW